jgi:hypothetical protein
MKSVHFFKFPILILFCLLLMSHACEKKIGDEEYQWVDEVVSNSEDNYIKLNFTGDYSDQWKKVDSLEQKGLYKSALDEVNNIFEKAKAVENSPEIVKAVLYKLKLSDYLREENLVMSITEVDSLAAVSNFPTKQILYSISAEAYARFYNQNRWKFINRTETKGIVLNDIRTWDLTTINRKIRENYDLSLTEINRLQKSALIDFKAMLNFYGESSLQRPTLYDFIAHRALNFYQNTELSLPTAEKPFVISSNSYFAANREFLEASNPTNDSISFSNDWQALKLLRELTAFHLNDKTPEALFDVELIRLNFVYTKSMNDTKADSYEAALRRLIETYSSNAIRTEAQYKLANLFSTQGNEYSIESPENRWKKQEAHNLCEKAIASFPESYGAGLCKNLLQSIEFKDIDFTTEKAYSSTANKRILVSYKNVDELYFRLIKTDPSFDKTYNSNREEEIKRLLKLPVEKAWTVQLHETADFQYHKTEFLLPTLGLGHYSLIASTKADFDLDTNSISYNHFYVSDLAFLFNSSSTEATNTIYVTNRETGAPIKNATIEVFTQKYDYTTSDYNYNKEQTLTTNDKGLAEVKNSDNYSNHLFKISKGTDVYFENQNLYFYREGRDLKPYSTTNFFTDRQIYRPGQTVYFKGIRIQHKGKEHKIEIGKTSEVVFRDANYQEVKKVKLTTNGYGTFSGSFVIPETGMTGQMSIEDGNGEVYFSVEEYKRPKFEVELLPLTGVYKLNSTIKVEGKSKTFSGVALDGAKVNYSIARSTSIPYWMYYYYRINASTSSKEIKNGTVTTDADGKFVIDFVAEKDPTNDTKYLPYYNYTISVDVVDITGETHSATNYISVGETALKLGINTSAEIEAHDGNMFEISASNLNGEAVNAAGTIKVHRLENKKQLYRASAWERPDVEGISEAAFRTLFPYDAFKKDELTKKGAIESTVLDRAWNTKTAKTIDFVGMNSWLPGEYMIELATKDSFGVDVKEIRYFTLFDKTSKKASKREIFNVAIVKQHCEPGETAEFLVSSADSNMTVLYELVQDGKIIKREFIKLSNAQQLISIPILESHRGNLDVFFTSFKHGRSFTDRSTIYVPFSNKELSFEFETFRDKLLPGQKEEWKIKIKGPKGEKVAAELLAAMYDASLDSYAQNYYYLSVFNANYSNRYWSSYSYGTMQSMEYAKHFNETSNSANYRNYDELNWWNYYPGNYYYYEGVNYGATYSFETMGREKNRAPIGQKNEMSLITNKVTLSSTNSVSQGFYANADAMLKDDQKENDKNEGRLKPLEEKSQGIEIANLGAVKARTNLNETAFFLPQLSTNEKGEVFVKFTLPESLTTWSFIGLAHTKDLKTGSFQKEVVAQKELMITPNPPRFLREGDKVKFTAKVSSLAGKDLKGTATLLLFDAQTNQPIDAAFKLSNAERSFDLKTGQSNVLTWELNVPVGIGAINYRVVAKAESHTDAEENTLPILSNRLLVTESLPLPSKGIGTKEFTFKKLVESGSSTSLDHHSLTLEYTSNPAWYAIQAMPYMMEYPYECAEQTFTRLYSNALATTIMNSNPLIKQVIDSWKNLTPDAFLSNLEKNQELKALLLKETPWLLEGQNETARKKKIALLFDLAKMDKELDRAVAKLGKMQVANGAWPWFPGMPENRYITQYIITGMGHLDHLKVKDVRENEQIWNMVSKGVNYLDHELVDDYNYIVEHDSSYLKNKHISEDHIQYLYARSFFKDLAMDGTTKKAFDYFQQQATTYWTDFSIYSEGMIALQAKRFSNAPVANEILKSIKERAINNEEMGMYWKDNVAGYYWYQAPIETQALLIEAFDEVTNDQVSVENMKVWLLKQKQTTDWKTTKATAEACYALLLRGTEILMNTEQVQIKVNGKTLDPKALGSTVEAGTGYFKTSWPEDKITPEMGNIEVIRKTEGVSWGAMYWQYFEDMDKITSAETPLKLKKQLFKVENSATVQKMNLITDQTSLKAGDKVRVRIELRSDRNMEYVHMKDMRAAGLEPVNVFTQYKYQDGLGYYESTADAATNFFFDYLPKGTYVFEYDLVVNLAGDFTNGITTIQCMYAPEFTSHSEGVRLKIEE